MGFKLKKDMVVADQLAQAIGTNGCRPIVVGHQWYPRDMRDSCRANLSRSDEEIVLVTTGVLSTGKG